jgi:hypothetical protein
MQLADTNTNWSFTCLTDPSGMPPPGGLVLQDVRHDGHNFAKDIRIIGLWLTTELVDPSGTADAPKRKFYVLDQANFTVSAVSTLVPQPLANPTYSKTFDYLRGSDIALNFTEYFKSPSGNYLAYGVTAKFDAPNLLSTFPNCEYAGLFVEQIILFSPYSNSPKHEPSGGLSAARCHPMIRYRFSKNASYNGTTKHTRVISIRFDYRLHLFLDRHYNVADNALLAQLGNQAGIFADSDSAIKTATKAFFQFSLFRGIWQLTKEKATAFSAGSFVAVEKPLVLEVMAPGLARGFPEFTETAIDSTPVNLRCWDNVHWWGSRGPGEPLISAPGAFHCAHTHWRWGAAGEKVVGGDPKFDPITWPDGMTKAAAKGMWGPLVDPAIWIQTIRFAVVKNDPRLDPTKGAAPSALSKDEWQLLFDPGLRPTPQDISTGDDIVLWYSAEVHREVTLSGSTPATYTSAAMGTVFIHGIFFAHDAEQTGLAKPIGSTDPAYRPNSKKLIQDQKRWFRSAN